MMAKNADDAIHKEYSEFQNFIVNIFPNGDFENGSKMQLPSTLTAFFIQAAELLKMKFATRAFTRSGFEICSLHEVCPGDILWISSGEDFIFPSLTTNTLQFEN
eukprot:jgi/Galph1/258/GphlegSOOS_G5007.1